MTGKAQAVVLRLGKIETISDKDLGKIRLCPAIGTKSPKAGRERTVPKGRVVSGKGKISEKTANAGIPLPVSGKIPVLVAAGVSRIPDGNTAGSLSAKTVNPVSGTVEVSASATVSKNAIVFKIGKIEAVPKNGDALAKVSATVTASKIGRVSKIGTVSLVATGLKIPRGEAVSDAGIRKAVSANVEVARFREVPRHSGAMPSLAGMPWKGGKPVFPGMKSGPIVFPVLPVRVSGVMNAVRLLAGTVLAAGTAFRVMAVRNAGAGSPGKGILSVTIPTGTAGVVKPVFPGARLK